MRQEVPQPWAEAMQAAGLSHRDQPSVRALARKAQEVTGTSSPSVEAVRQLVHGVVTANNDTVRAVATALRLSPQTVSDWNDVRRTVAEPYTPPSAADLLTHRQRKALDELIHAMTEQKVASRGAPMKLVRSEPTDQQIADAAAFKPRTRRRRDEVEHLDE